ncbi:MAG: Bug family tripartite tricarboxylate transporter substrate binding protein, partial [Burkholderiales bacterium]
MAVVCLASALFAFTSGAQTYPDKPVRVIVPAPPGGALDIVARYVTQKLGEPFGTQFIVDNRGGAGGGIGADVAARAVPDGYTLLLSSSSAVSVNPHFVPKAADPLKVFAPIVLVGFSPNVLVIHPSVPAKSAKELIAVAKARPDALAFGSNGAGSLSHLTGALFMQRAGIRMLHVPYKGAAPAVIDTM